MDQNPRASPTWPGIRCSTRCSTTIDFDAVLNVRKLLAWMEATAEWGAHQALRDDSNVDAAARQRYASELKRFLQDPGGQLLKGTITDRRPYGAFIFASFLEERLGVEAIRRTWERIDNTWFPEADVQITGPCSRLPPQYGRRTAGLLARQLPVVRHGHQRRGLPGQLALQRSGCGSLVRLPGRHGK
nr:hypothetical protein [Streptomyces cahuitamycinicus]